MFSRGCPDMCDAYHSMEELYEFRKLYNAALLTPGLLLVCMILIKVGGTAMGSCALGVDGLS